MWYAEISILIIYQLYCSRKQLFDDILLCFNLKVTLTELTRIFTNANNVTSTSKIDYILTNDNSSSVQAKVFDGHFDWSFEKMKYYISKCSSVRIVSPKWMTYLIWWQLVALMIYINTQILMMVPIDFYNCLSISFKSHVLQKDQITLMLNVNTG